MAKDWNYYKTISDICAEYNDIYRKFNAKDISLIEYVPLLKEPNEGQRYLLQNAENKYLVVETSTDFHWVGTRLILKSIADLNINMTKYLHDNDQENPQGVQKKLFVFTYVEGEPISDYLKRISSEEAYSLGYKLGKNLRKLHLVEVDSLKHHIVNWKSRYEWKMKGIIQNYQYNQEIDKVFNFYKENSSFIDKYHTALFYSYDEDGKVQIEKLLSFINSEITMGNLVVNNGEPYIKSAININIADPYYEFKYISLIALDNAFFATGILDGYFDKKVPAHVFNVIKIYTSELIIEEFGKKINNDILSQIIASYEDYNLEIPKWYKSSL